MSIRNKVYPIAGIASIKNKKIVMISDYVDPATYHPTELADEKAFIKQIRNDMASCGQDFEYVEVKNKSELIKLLNKNKPNNTIIFNWCEALQERENSGQEVVALLEKHDYVFTGADSKCLKYTDNKLLAKKLLIKNKVNTPGYKVVSMLSDLDEITFSYPSIVKYANMHGSSHINEENVVNNFKSLKNISGKMLSKNLGNLLIEEFIDGDEYSVHVWGNGKNVQMLPPSKIEFLNNKINRIQTEDSKFDMDSKDFQNTRVSLLLDNTKTVVNNIEKNVLRAYDILCFKDYGRFEVRIKDDTVYVIDANPNPALSLENSLVKSSRHLGYGLGSMIVKICKDAMDRKYEKT